MRPGCNVDASRIRPIGACQTARHNHPSFAGQHSPPANQFAKIRKLAKLVILVQLSPGIPRSYHQ
jgi:hypothetical protein